MIIRLKIFLQELDNNLIIYNLKELKIYILYIFTLICLYYVYFFINTMNFYLID